MVFISLAFPIREVTRFEHSDQDTAKRFTSFLGVLAEEPGECHSDEGTIWIALILAWGLPSVANPPLGVRTRFVSVK